MFSFLLFLIIGYLLGSIPFGYLLAKSKGVDIKQVGSGNIGATNVLRALGLKWAILDGILDISKGIVPVLLAINYLTLDWQIVLVAAAPILGHIFPVWLKFKGGKGVSTVFATLMVLLDWKIFLGWFLIWFLVFIIFRIISFTNLLMVSFLPLAFWFDSLSLIYFTFGVFLFGLVWWAHRENLQRIALGKELRVSLKGRSRTYKSDNLL